VLVWVALLLVFAVGFVLVLQHHDTTTKAGGGGRRGAGTGPVTLTTTTATKGDIGVYLDAIGTVTPVYTAAITSQVTGPVIAVHFTEGQIVGKGASLIDIDPRPFQATLMQAQGTLERDEAILAQATMDRDRFRDAWARNAIPKQTLDDQEKIVLPRNGGVRPGAAWILPHHGADLGQGGSAAGGPGQRGAVHGRDVACGDYATAADHGNLHHS